MHWLDADIVHFHYWNSPEFNDLWSRQLPPMRSLVSSEVNGQHPPHLITREVMDMADIFVAASPITLELDLVKSMGYGKTDLVFAGADFARLDDIRAEDHAAFNVGYIGTIDFAKMHPKFVAMSAMSMFRTRALSCAELARRSGRSKNRSATLAMKHASRFSIMSRIFATSSPSSTFSGIRYARTTTVRANLSCRRSCMPAYHPSCCLLAGRLI